MKDIKDIIRDLEDEQFRAKLWCNENGYHVGTSVWQVVHRYRNEMKQLIKVMRGNTDEITNFSEADDYFNKHKDPQSKRILINGYQPAKLDIDCGGNPPKNPNGNDNYLTEEEAAEILREASKEGKVVPQPIGQAAAKPSEGDWQL